jgi:hypothetical protein
MGNRQVVERYARAGAEDDLETQVALLHPEYIGRYPQSGEVIRGPEAFRAIAENYPGHGAAPLTVTAAEIRGADDQFLARPSWPAWTVVQLAGSDDEFTLAGQIHYPNGETWHAVALLTLKAGKIWRETDYFAAPFEPAEWRRPFVEVEGAHRAGEA